MSRKDYVKFKAFKILGKIVSAVGCKIYGDTEYNYHVCKYCGSVETHLKGVTIKDNMAEIRVELKDQSLDEWGVITIADHITGATLLMTSLKQVTVIVIDIYGEQAFRYSTNLEALERIELMM